VPTFANAHALVVGIADYQQIKKLPAVKDATEVASLLANPAFCGYPEGNVRLLRDAEATQAAIRQALADLAGKIDRESTVFVYFSGHGGRVLAGAHAGEYLLPVDTVYPGDEDLARTAIATEEFTAALNRIGAGKVLVVLDCCHAGGIGEVKHVGPVEEVRPGLSENAYLALAAGHGRAILASSRAQEFSYVPDRAEYGLFTQHLLDGLRGGAASEDGVIRIFDLFCYLQPRVSAAHPRQHPYFKFQGDENLPIALYRGGVKGEIRRVEGEYLFDAYISYADREPDAGYVWKTLLPRLKQEGLRVAVSNDSEDPGVDRVVGIERGIERAKRTVILLTDNFLRDHWAEFQSNAAITKGLEEGRYVLLPVKMGPVGTQIPLRIRKLVALDLAHPYRADQEWDRLIRALRGPAPRMGK
jgi:hypothetical protein